MDFLLKRVERERKKPLRLGARSRSFRGLVVVVAIELNEGSWFNAHDRHTGSEWQQLPEMRGAAVAGQSKSVCEKRKVI